MLQFESRTYRIHGITPMLGVAPASKTLRTEYIISKAPTDALRQEEIDNTPDLDDKGLTVFDRDNQDRLCFMGYKMKGFFKEALDALQAQLGVLRPGGKIDKLVAVEPRYIPIMRNGEYLREEDSVNERPLRAKTMPGDRVALASSEQIDDPWEFEIEVSLFPNGGTAKSKAITWDALETALDYGAWHGLGGWRNADWGRFTWERTDEHE